MPPRQEPANSTSMATATQTVVAVPFRRQIVVVVAAPALPVRPSPSDRESMCPCTLFQPLFGFLPRTRAEPRPSTAHALRSDVRRPCCSRPSGSSSAFFQPDLWSRHATTAMPGTPAGFPELKSDLRLQTLHRVNSRPLF